MFECCLNRDIWNLLVYCSVSKCASNRSPPLISGEANSTFSLPVCLLRCILHGAENITVVVAHYYETERGNELCQKLMCDMAWQPMKGKNLRLHVNLGIIFNITL